MAQTDGSMDAAALPRSWPAGLSLPDDLPCDEQRRRNHIEEFAKGLADCTCFTLDAAALPLHIEIISVACPKLQHLDLSGCSNAVDDDTAVFIAELSTLVTLRLAHCAALTDVGLGALATGPAVESREVRTGVRSRGLYAALGAALGGTEPGLPSLTSLDLSGCVHVGDGGLMRIAEGCAALAELSLSGCVGVRDRGILAVARNRRLKSVVLDGCSRVSDTAVCTLARQCPLEALSLANGGPISAFAARALGALGQDDSRQIH